MLQWSSSNTCTFAVKHCTALLHVRILDNTYVLCLVAILRSEITGKKHKKFLSVVLNRMCKGPMFTAGELIEEDRVSPRLLSAGNMHVGYLKSLCHSAQKCWEVLLMLQINFSE